MMGMSRSAIAREKWTLLVEKQRLSGLSATRFCAERSVPASAFFVWKRRLASPGLAATFVEAALGGVESERPTHEDDGACAGRCAGGVLIELARGRRIIVERWLDRQLLLEVLAGLDSRIEARTEGAGGGMIGLPTFPFGKLKRLKISAVLDFKAVKVQSHRRRAGHFERAVLDGQHKGIGRNDENHDDLQERVGTR
jgi:hypothetical protein